ncbi:hypothetical protein KIN20_010150 [Parelaphostrongylus tenuis]|uniref:Uncharacterized protein n=1 Tax=Parelaphostrongylus tenuis TaxID=148309 RepID=A0AAD5MTJ6_PARTN|nr:hypothetical protein KIN20_010150 [Parelaphostrongylus tenuis]
MDKIQSQNSFSGNLDTRNFTEYELKLKFTMISLQRSLSGFSGLAQEMHNLPKIDVKCAREVVLVEECQCRSTFRVHKDEETMLKMCKNCMETIRAKMSVVDKLREELEVDMIVGTDRLDDLTRRLKRQLITITRMHMTVNDIVWRHPFIEKEDSTEATERLSKLFDIDLDAEAKMKDLLKVMADLEDQQKLNQSVFYRIHLCTRSLVDWIVHRIVMFVRWCRGLCYTAIQIAQSSSPTIQSERHNEELDVPFVPNKS